MVQHGEPLDYVAALGRLLSSPTLFQEFCEDRLAVLDALNVRSHDREPLLRIDANQLREQADALVLKRWHEVQQLAPVTTKALADRGEELFRFFAATSWPEGHRRHLIDASSFLEFLAANKICRPNRAEQRTLRRRSK